MELPKELCCPQGLVQAVLLKAHPCSFQDFCRSFLDGEGCAGFYLFIPGAFLPVLGQISDGYPVVGSPRNPTSVQTLGLLHFQCFWKLHLCPSMGCWSSRLC